ncbi:MAG: hypothetical protein ACTIKM_05365, partial [Microbacterium gubbeenense]
LRGTVLDCGVQLLGSTPLIRQYFPKGTDLSRWSEREIVAVAHAINNRPREILGWRTPAEAFSEKLLSVEGAAVATTG